jgi:hypothetical protein
MAIKCMTVAEVCLNQLSKNNRVLKGRGSSRVVNALSEAALATEGLKGPLGGDGSRKLACDLPVYRT